MLGKSHSDDEKRSVLARASDRKNSQSLTRAVTHTHRDYKNPVARAVHRTVRRRNHAEAWSTAAVKREGTLELGPLGARSILAHTPLKKKERKLR